MTGTRLERRARTKRRHDASTEIITIFFLSLCLSFTKITITIILFDKISPRAPDGNYYKTETCRRRRRARFHLRERGRRRRTIEKFIAPPISINSVRKQFSACVSSRCAPDEPNVVFFFFIPPFRNGRFSVFRSCDVVSKCPAAVVIHRWNYRRAKTTTTVVPRQCHPQNTNPAGSSFKPTKANCRQVWNVKRVFLQKKKKNASKSPGRQRQKRKKNRRVNFYNW